MNKVLCGPEPENREKPPFNVKYIFMLKGDSEESSFFMEKNKMDEIKELMDENERQWQKEAKMTNEELALYLQIQDNEEYGMTE